MHPGHQQIIASGEKFQNEALWVGRCWKINQNRGVFPAAVARGCDCVLAAAAVVERSKKIPEGCFAGIAAVEGPDGVRILDRSADFD